MVTSSHASSVSKQDYRDIFEAIYRNQYFTNHGPLAQEFEKRLEEFLSIENLVTVGNESLALLIALAGLELNGAVFLPETCGTIPKQVASWLNLDVDFYESSQHLSQTSFDNFASVLSQTAEAIVLVESKKARCDPALIERLAELDLKVVIVAFETFGIKTGGRYVDANPNVVTVFSFGPGQTLSTLQGGAIATNNNEWAHRFRNTRSSYGVREKVDVKATCNGRFSEFQAGLGIKGLSNLIRAINGGGE